MATIVVPPNVVKNWEKSGKDDVFRLCKNCVRGKEGELSLSDSNFQCGENDLKRVIYEVFCHVIRGDLKQEDALSLLSDVTEFHSGCASLLADLICILGTQALSNYCCYFKNMFFVLSDLHRLTAVFPRSTGLRDCVCCVCALCILWFLVYS